MGEYGILEVWVMRESTVLTFLANSEITSTNLIPANPMV